eukprot:3081813-Pyramimonas_sp.AAC.1
MSTTDVVGGRPPLFPPLARTIVGLTSEDHHEALHPSQFPSFEPGAGRTVQGAAARLPILPSQGDAKSLKT